MPNRKEITNQSAGTRLKGISRTIRVNKNLEAEIRNEATPENKRRAYRLNHSETTE